MGSFVYNLCGCVELVIMTKMIVYLCACRSETTSKCIAQSCDYTLALGPGVPKCNTTNTTHSRAGCMHHGVDITLATLLTVHTVRQQSTNNMVLRASPKFQKRKSPA